MLPQLCVRTAPSYVSERGCIRIIGAPMPSIALLMCHLCGTRVSLARHSCVTCAALMCHNSIFHAFSRIVTHESAEMRLGNHPDQPLHPPIAPPRYALQPASALNLLQPSRTAFAALTGIALITALMSPRVSRSVLRAASTIFGSESVQCSTKSAILPYPAAAKIP